LRSDDKPNRGYALYYKIWTAITRIVKYAEDYDFPMLFTSYIERLFFHLLFFFLLGYWHCGHSSWPVVPASGNSEDDCGEADGM
jgi:hypothetical protein